MSENNGKTLALQAADATVPAAIEAALLEGDVQRLRPEERTAYYRAICESVGLNWLTRPLDLIKGQDGAHRFYFRKEATDQLARANNISFTTMSRERMEDLYIVEVRGAMPNGRTLDDQGIVPYVEKSGATDRANAMMKATTKARRRVTLGLVGLGWQVAEDNGEGSIVDFALESGRLISEEAEAEDHSQLLFGDRDAVARVRTMATRKPESRLPGADQTPPAAANVTEVQPDAASRTTGADEKALSHQTGEERKRLAKFMAELREKAAVAEVGVVPLLTEVERHPPEGWNKERLASLKDSQVGSALITQACIVLQHQKATEAEAPAGEKITEEGPPPPGLTLDKWLDEVAFAKKCRPEDVKTWLRDHDEEDLFGQAAGLDPCADLPECLDKLDIILASVVL